MTKRIYKYQLSVGSNVVTMPACPGFLHVDVQRGRVCAWAIVETEAEEAQRAIAVVGTGWDVSDFDRADHIGSVYDRESGMVWHAFDLGISEMEGLT